MAVWTMYSASPALDRTRRNAKIVKLLRARKLTMAEIGGMFGLSTGAIALIAKARGVRPFDPEMVRKAIRLIDRGSRRTQRSARRLARVLERLRAPGLSQGRRVSLGQKKDTRWASSVYSSRS